MITREETVRRLKARQRQHIEQGRKELLERARKLSITTRKDNGND